MEALLYDYDSPLSAFGGEVIPKVANFYRERFGDHRRMRLRKRIFENMLVHTGN